MQQQPTIIVMHSKGFDPNDPKYQGLCGCASAKVACIVLGCLMFCLDASFNGVIAKEPSLLVYGIINTLAAVLTVVFAVTENSTGLMICRVINIIQAVLFAIATLIFFIIGVAATTAFGALGSLIIVGAVITGLLCAFCSWAAATIKTFRLFLEDREHAMASGQQPVVMQPGFPQKAPGQGYPQPPLSPHPPQAYHPPPQQQGYPQQGYPPPGYPPQQQQYHK